MFSCSTSRLNDLDVNTLRALEEALENFAGCAVVISHDSGSGSHRNTYARV